MKYYIAVVNDKLHSKEFHEISDSMFIRFYKGNLNDGTY